jgi:hypothetical protein
MYAPVPTRWFVRMAVIDALVRVSEPGVFCLQTNMQSVPRDSGRDASALSSKRGAHLERAASSSMLRCTGTDRPTTTSSCRNGAFSDN